MIDVVRALAVCALVAGSIVPSNAAAGPPAELIVKGRVLAVDDSYLVFTTGDSVRLGTTSIPKGVGFGSTVRVHIDPETHLVTLLELESGAPEPREIDASALPREVVAVDPRSARTAEQIGPSALEGAPGAATITIEVAVPDFTPPGDTIYLSTDRTNFSSAELRMNRLDALHWTISLPLADGSTLRYDFTRGSPGTVERQRNGTIVTPRELTAAPGTRANAVVARWADKF
jgi:hypothetical protein